MTVANVPAQNGGYQSIFIRKITITETPPGVSFNLAPATTSIACGSTTPVTFTINNGAGTTGITGYTWNLGTTPNGWKYNNAAAPATITTGSTVNTLTLTPDCGKALSSISATVAANGNNYQTNTSTVTVTVPSLSISGASSFCTGSQSYSVSNLPCNATVSWSSSNTSIATVSATGNPATATKTGNGNVTITATFQNTCNSQPVSKQIRVGTYSTSEIAFDPTSGPPSYGQSSTPFCLGQKVYFALNSYSVPDATSYQWFYSNSWQYISGQGTRIICLKVNPSASSSSGYVGVIPGNACGNSSTMTPITYGFNRNCMSGNLKTNSFEAYPNPAADNMIIQSNSAALSDKSSIQPEIREVRIVNKMGIVQYSKKFDKGITSATISVSGLLTDIYTLMIYNGSQWDSQQITIKH